MSGEEFDAIHHEDVDPRFVYELARGVLIVNPIPLAGERGPNGLIEFLLRLYQYQHPEGSALDGTLFEEYIYLTPDDRRRCDRAIWCGLGRAPHPERDTPSIVIEIVSGRKRDRDRDYQIKRQEYLDHGIQEYWVIDRFARTMTVFHRPPHEPAEEVVPESGTYRTLLLPGFELPLSRVFLEADRWGSVRSKRPRPRGRDGGLPVGPRDPSEESHHGHPPEP
jgi:Uma2 family endonuclease